MNIYMQIAVLTGLGLAGHIVWYGGGFLPISAIVIRQEKSIARTTFLRWGVIYTVAALTIGLILLFVRPSFMYRLVAVINNVFFISFGLFTLIQVVRGNTPPKQSQIEKIVFIIAIAQAILVYQVIAAVLITSNEIQWFHLVIAIACFIVAALIQTGIVAWIFWLIASTSQTKKLQRYLAGLFAFLCIVIGILNFL